MRPQRTPHSAAEASTRRDAPANGASATILPFPPGGQSGDRIHAYVDRQLDQAERAGVEAQLRRRPLDRLRAAAYRALNGKLRALFSDEPPAMSPALRELASRAAEHFAGGDEEAPLIRRC